MIAYRGPMLIAEPELRWPIVLLAAAITALLAILTAGLYYVAMTKTDVNSYTEPRLERALQPGETEFEEFRQHIAIEQLVGIEKVHPFDTLAVAMTATVEITPAVPSVDWNCGVRFWTATVRVCANGQ